jgi:hypothetical protein
MSPFKLILFVAILFDPSVTELQKNRVFISSASVVLPARGSWRENSIFQQSPSVRGIWTVG